jgi:hypothetical protein
MQSPFSFIDYLPEQPDLLPCTDGGTGRQIDPPRSLQMEARQLAVSLGFLASQRGAVE